MKRGAAARRVMFAMVVAGAAITAYVATESAAVSMVAWIATILAAVALIHLIENGDM